MSEIEMERAPFAVALTQYIIAMSLRMANSPLSPPSDSEVRLYEEILARTEGL
jgi:hypothetical protein